MVSISLDVESINLLASVIDMINTGKVNWLHLRKNLAAISLPWTDC